jgi:hypothetical protein
VPIALIFQLAFKNFVSEKLEGNELAADESALASIENAEEAEA